MPDCISFNKEIFDYFFTKNDNSVRLRVKNIMNKLGGELIKSVRKIDPFYSNYEVGKLQFDHDHCWLAFGPIPNNKAKKYRKWAHQTITVDAQGIEVFINVELKNATDLFKKKITFNTTQFKNHLSALIANENITIRIEERRQQQAMIYKYLLLAQFDSNYFINPVLESYSFESLIKLLIHIPLPYISIRKRIRRNAVLELSSEDQGIFLLNEIIQTMRNFHPLVKFMNEPEYE